MLYRYWDFLNYSDGMLIFLLYLLLEFESCRDGNHVLTVFLCKELCDLLGDTSYISILNYIVVSRGVAVGRGALSSSTEGTVPVTSEEMMKSFFEGP